MNTKKAIIVAMAAAMLLTSCQTNMEKAEDAFMDYCVYSDPSIRAESAVTISECIKRMDNSERRKFSEWCELQRNEVKILKAQLEIQ